MQGNITFSVTQEVSVVSAGFYASRHVASRWCFRHRIGRHRRGTSRWVPGNQPSLGAFMTICRSRFPLADSTRSSRHPYSRLFDSPTSPWHLYTRGTFTSHGFHGESLDCRHGAGLLETHVDYYLRPPFMSEIKSVALAWNQSVRGVMGHTPLPLCPPSTYTVMSRGFRCTWVRSDSCTPEWPKFGPTTIPNFCGHDTGGGVCVRTVGRMTTALFHGLRVAQGC